MAEGINYGELVQAIQDYAEYDETKFVDNIPLFVKLTERSIWGFLNLPYYKLDAPAVTIASDRFVTVPTDFLAPLSLGVINPATSEIEYLLNKDVSFMREVFPGSTEAIPQFYGMFNESTFILAPVPDQAYTLEILYTGVPPTLVGADSNTTWLSEHGFETLLYGCLREGYTFMKGELELINEYKERYVVGLKNLKNLGEAMDLQDIYRSGELRRAPA